MALHGNEAGIKYLVLIILKIIKKGKKTFIFLLRVLRRRNLLQDYPKTGKKTTNGVIHIASWVNPRWRLP